MFEAMDDNAHMQERAADIHWRCQTYLSTFIRCDSSNQPMINEEVMVVYDLTPSDTAQLDRTRMLKPVTGIGGRTSRINNHGSFVKSCNRWYKEITDKK